MNKTFLLLTIFTVSCTADATVNVMKSKVCNIFKGEQECRDIVVDCHEEDPFVEGDVQCGFSCDNKDAVSVCEGFGGTCDVSKGCHLVMPNKCLAVTMACKGTEDNNNCCGSCVDGFCE